MIGSPMTPERWRQIEELYHSVHARGLAVPEDTDPELRREVERLLAQDSDGKVLDRPASELLEDFAVTEGATAGPGSFGGQTISRSEERRVGKECRSRWS